MTGGLAIMMCHARIDAKVCCDSAAASDGLTIMMCQAPIYAAVCCAGPAATGRPSYTDVSRADIRCSVLPLRCSACSLAGYVAWLYTAKCSICAAALAKTAMCFALLYAAVPALPSLTALVGTLL